MLFYWKPYSHGFPRCIDRHSWTFWSFLLNISCTKSGYVNMKNWKKEADQVSQTSSKVVIVAMDSRHACSIGKPSVTHSLIGGYSIARLDQKMGSVSCNYGKPKIIPVGCKCTPNLARRPRYLYTVQADLEIAGPLWQQRGGQQHGPHENWIGKQTAHLQALFCTETNPSLSNSD